MKPTLFALLASAAALNAATFVWDGGSGNWTDPSWNTGGAPGDSDDSDGNIDGAAADTYEITSPGSNVGVAARLRIDGTLTVTDSSLRADSGGNLSGIVVGDNGAASAVWTGSTITSDASGTAGRSLDLNQGSSLVIDNSTVVVTREDAPFAFDIRGAGNSVLFTNNSILNAGRIELSQGSDFTFVSGSISLANSNSLQSNGDGFAGAFNWTGLAGAGSIVHTDLSGTSGQQLAGKTASGYFSIDGVTISPTTAYDGSNLAELNTELFSLSVGGRALQLSDTGSEQTLSLVNIPEPGVALLAALGCLGLARRRRA